MGLTKEEKNAIKLANKLENEKAAVEAQKKQKLKELEREVAITNLQQFEVTNQLQKMISEAKAPVYKRNIEIMCHTFDRTCDKRNELINILMHLRRVADSQYQSTIGGFCEVVDGIIRTFLKDLEAMLKQSQTKITVLLQQGRDDKNDILKGQKKSETYLQLLLYHTNDLADSRKWETRGKNFVIKDEYMCKFREIRNDIRAFLEGSFTTIWEEYKATCRHYFTSTADNQKQMRVLRKKENRMADIIATQAKKIAASEGVIRRLRAELISYESGTKQSAFRDRRKRHRDAYLQMKQCLKKSADADGKQLNRLVRESDNSIEHLSNACQKNEKILRMAALCRKFENQKEKVLPFGTTIPHETSQPEGSPRHPKNSLIFNAMTSSCSLTRFWQRISKAELSKRALYQEKMLLERENADIMRELAELDAEKFSSRVTLCSCISKASRKTLDQPHAVDGSLEFRKKYSLLNEDF